MRRFRIPFWAMALTATLTVSLAVLLPFTFASATEPTGQQVEKPPVRVPDRQWCGVCIIDLDTGMPLVWQNADTPYVPASVTKVVTAAAVTALRDSNECIITEVYTTAPIDSKHVKGDLVVVAAGDPTLDGSFTKAVVRQLKSAGVSKLEGRVRVDTLSAFRDSSVPAGWERSDVAASYGRPLHAATYKRNTATKKVTRTVKERVGKGKKRRTRSRQVTTTTSVTNFRPDTTLCQDLTAALKDAGIEIGGQPGLDSKNRYKLMAHKSLRMADMIKATMSRSDNLYAEGLLRRLSQGDTRAEALAEERDFLSDPDSQIRMDGIEINDGSGLSRTNRMTPIFLVDLLTRMASDPQIGTTYMRLFPRCGVEGTVRGLLRGTPLAGKVALKSGTMRDVVSYAGYAFLDEYDPGRPTHVIVMMANRFPGSRPAVRQQMARMLLDLFAPDGTVGEEPESELDEIFD